MAAPPSMLGSFSTLGGPPVRGRTPPHEKPSSSPVPEKGTERPERSERPDRDRMEKLHGQETRYLIDTRVSFPYELLPPMALQQRPVQYKNPTEPDQPPTRKSQQAQQPVAAADEPRQQVIYFGQPHLSHGQGHHHGHHGQGSPGASSFKFGGGGGSPFSVFERPQTFPQSLFSPFANAPIYGQPSAELYRKDSATQAPLFFRGGLPAVPQQTPRPPPPAQHIPDFRFVPPITSSALDHSLAALTQSFGPPGERGKQGQSGYPLATTKLPFQGHQSQHQSGFQSAFQSPGFLSHQQPKPGFHLKDATPTKESFSTKRPQLQLQQASNVNKQPLIPSPKFPSDDFGDGLSAFAHPAKPGKTTLVNFGLHANRDEGLSLGQGLGLGRPNKIKLTDGNPVDDGKDERPGPPHSYAQINTPHGLSGLSGVSLTPQQHSDEGSFPPRLSFGKEDAKFGGNGGNGGSGIQQRPPEKQRITRPFFQDDIEAKPGPGLHHSLHGLHHGFSLAGLGGLGGLGGLAQQTSPNYGPQTFPTPPNFAFEHRPANPGAYVPLFAATPSPTPEPLEAFQTTTPYREETTLPPTHINEVHSPPLRPTSTSATRHRFQPSVSVIRDEDDDIPPALAFAEDKEKEKPSFHKRVPAKGRRRKPYATSSTTTTTTTEEPPAVQLDRQPNPTDDPGLEVHELEYPPEPFGPFGPFGTADAPVPGPAPSTAAPLTTTPRPLRRKKPSRNGAPGDRLRNRLVPPELIKTTTPEPDTTTLFPDTTTLPDVGDFRLPDHPKQHSQAEQEYGLLFAQPPSAVPTLQDFSSLEDFKMEEPVRPNYPNEYTKPEEQYTKYAGDEYKLDYPKTDYPKESIPDAGPSSFSIFDRPGASQEPSAASPTLQQPLSSATPTQAEQTEQSEQVADAQEEPQTTAAPAVETTTATLSSRLRPRIRFNATRPRFSVKDYRGKPGKDGEAEASATSTTVAPAPAASNRGRLPSRTRGSHRHTTEADRAEAPSTESSRLRYRTKDPLRFNSNNRHRSTSTTSTTTTEAPAADAVESGSEVTEKASDKLISRFRPGTGKYYSRYRTSTSTEAPAAEGARLERPSLKAPPGATRTKGVFSVRRPAATAASKQGDDADEGENYPAHHPGTLPTPKTHILRLGTAAPTTAATDNDRSDTVHENEVLPAPGPADAAGAHAPSSTPSAAPSSAAPAPTADQPGAGHAGPSSAWSPVSGSLGDLSDVHIDSSSEDMMLSPSQRVAELTSSPGNNYNNPGVFKSVMPASRRTPLKVSLSTDDPILPIEAFFNSWSKDQKSS